MHFLPSELSQPKHWPSWLLSCILRQNTISFQGLSTLLCTIPASATVGKAVEVRIQILITHVRLKHVAPDLCVTEV